MFFDFFYLNFCLIVFCLTELSEKLLVVLNKIK